jgi:biofilm protein TabA
MILSTIRDFRRYQGLNSRFGVLADLLSVQNLAELSAGRHDLVGDDLYVIASPQAQTRPTAMLEAHRRCIDVQIVIAGIEAMGWAPLSSLVAPDQPFDTVKDIVFFRDSPQSVHSVGAGHLAIFFPEDAHAPLLGDGHQVHKCVFKIRVDDA